MATLNFSINLAWGKFIKFNLPIILRAMLWCRRVNVVLSCSWPGLLCLSSLENYGQLITSLDLGMFSNYGRATSQSGRRHLICKALSLWLRHCSCNIPCHWLRPCSAIDGQSLMLFFCKMTLRWRNNGRDSVSNHQPHDCLLNLLVRRRSTKTSKLRDTGLCAGTSMVIGEFPAQMASNAEDVSTGWRYHG